MTSPVRKIGIPLAAIVILLTMVAWMAGFFSDKLSPGLNTPSTPDDSDAITAMRSDIAIVEPVPASVEAKQATIISSRILARINKVNVRAGDSVEQGQVLLELEQKDLVARAQQTAGQVRGVSARLKEAQQNLARVEELYDRQLVARAELDKARANHDALQAELASARQANEEAEAALAFSEIRAPIDGRVVDRFAEPGDTASPGNKLLSLYNPLTLRVEAEVREQLALSLQEGQQLQVAIPSLDTVLEAVIEERVPAADPGSRSFLVKARLPFNKQLLPGMYARLLVPAGAEQKLQIPADRVVEVGQLNLVWVLQDGQAYRRFVRLGKEDDAGNVEVLAGLAEGDRILPVPAEPNDDAVGPGRLEKLK